MNAGKASLTDAEVKKLMLENPELGARQFCVRYKVGDHRWSRLRQEIAEELAEKREKQDPDSPLPQYKNKYIYNKYYTYNDLTDTYVTFLKSSPKPLVVDGETHRAMQRAYSNWDGEPASINEICRTFSFPRTWFIEYKERHGWTHDKEPFTQEELLNREVPDMVEEALEQRRNILYQQYEQRKWLEVKDDAEKWRAFQKGTLLPFNTAIEQWRPSKPFVSKTVKSGDKYHFIVTASDWHIGLKAIEEDLTAGHEWNVEVGTRAVHSYLQKISDDVARLKVNWGTCYLFDLGDIPQGLRGYTEAETPIAVDVVKRQQYDAVFSLLTYFIEGLHAIFGDVEEIGVAGNHEGFDWYPIARALQERYRGNAGIRVSANTKMVVHRRIGKTLFILTHGKNPFGFKFKYAVRDGEKRNSQLQAEIIRVLREIGDSQPQDIKGILDIYVVMGEYHFYRQVEHGTYTDMQFGTLIFGDSYSDGSRLMHRPSQGCMLLSEEQGVRGILKYYFDDVFSPVVVEEVEK